MQLITKFLIITTIIAIASSMRVSNKTKGVKGVLLDSILTLKLRVFNPSNLEVNDYKVPKGYLALCNRDFCKDEAKNEKQSDCDALGESKCFKCPHAEENCKPCVHVDARNGKKCPSYCFSTTSAHNCFIDMGKKKAQEDTIKLFNADGIDIEKIVVEGDAKGSDTVEKFVAPVVPTKAIDEPIKIKKDDTNKVTFFIFDSTISMNRDSTKVNGKTLFEHQQDKINELDIKENYCYVHTDKEKKTKTYFKKQDTVVKVKLNEASQNYLLGPCLKMLVDSGLKKLTIITDGAEKVDSTFSDKSVNDYLKDVEATVIILSKEVSLKSNNATIKFWEPHFKKLTSVVTQITR